MHPNEPNIKELNAILLDLCTQDRTEEIAKKIVTVERQIERRLKE